MILLLRIGKSQKPYNNLVAGARNELIGLKPIPTSGQLSTTRAEIVAKCHFFHFFSFHFFEKQRTRKQKDKKIKKRRHVSWPHHFS
jgi:hypothetical protein